MAERRGIESHLQALLQPDRCDDYGPNGLQVEGRAEVRHIACGVTARLAFIACGHHVIERCGAPVMAAHIAARFGIEPRCIEIDNPA